MEEFQPEEENQNYLSGNYFDFFFNIGCLYRAVNFSACQPVMIISPIHVGGSKLGSLSLIDFNNSFVKKEELKR
jgi:hypothetical protein